MILGPKKTCTRLWYIFFFGIAVLLFLHFFFLLITNTTPETHARSLREPFVVQSPAIQNTSLATTMPQTTSERDTTKTVSKKLFIAICVPTKSIRNWRSLEHTALQTKLLPSIDKTVTEDYDVRIYLAIDHDDEFWQKYVGDLKTRFPIDHEFYITKKNKIPFNELTQHAYEGNTFDE